VQCFQLNREKWKPTITHQDYYTDIKIKPNRQPGKFTKFLLIQNPPMNDF